MSKPARRRPSLLIERLEDRINPALIGLEAADVPVSVSAGVDGTGEVAMRADGSGFVVAFSTADAGGLGVYFKRYDANWQLVQGPVAVNTFTTNDQVRPSVAIDGSGNFVIAYESFGQDPGDSSGQSGIYARRYTAAGAAVDAAEFRVNTTTLSQQRTPDVGVNAAGQITVVYRTGVSVNTILAQSYSSTTGTLTTVGGEVTVRLGDGTINATVPKIDLDATGNYVVTYQLDAQDGDDFGIYAQRLSPAGAVLSAEFKVNTVTAGAQQLPDIAMDGAGNFNIVWYSPGVDGAGTAIVMQRYNASAVAQGGNIQVNTGITTGNQIDPHVSANAGGTFLVTWHGEESDLDALGADAYYKLFDSSGGVLVGDTLINLGSAANDQTEGNVVSGITTSGDFVVAFETAAGANFDSVLRRYAEAPVVQFASTGSSPSEATASSSYTVNRTAASYVIANVSTLVSVTRTGGTATPGSDFGTSFPQTVTIGAGSTGQSASVAITQDTLFEGNETIIKGIGASANYTIGATSSRTITIVDDDPAPTVSVSSPTVTEGNGGTVNLTFTISLNTASGIAVTGNFATANATATAGSDYVSTSGAFTIPASGTSTTVTVTVNGDTLFEANEQLALNLTGITNAGNSTASGTGTITNDDTAPTISVSSPTVTEGDSGSVSLTYTLSLSAVSGVAVTGNYATGTGTATAGTDYTALGSTPFTIGAGATSTIVVVNVLSDTLFETNETVPLNLSGVTGTSNATATGTGTIADNDAAATISISSGNNQSTIAGTAFASPLVALVRNANNNPVEGVTVTFTPPGAGASASFATGTTTTNASGLASTGTATANATAGGPYTVSAAATGGTNPSVNFSLTNTPANSLSINDVTLAEGNGGTTTFAFTVSLSAAAGAGGVTFDIATANNTATSADADFVAQTLTAQTIPAGQTSYTFNVTVNGDAKFEANETFFVNVTNVTGASVTDGQGQGTITNDDTAPTLSINDVTVTEGNAGPVLAVFTVTQSAVSGLTTTVNFATADNGAAAGTDYTANSGTLTFIPGVTTQTVSVLVSGDTVFENTQGFFVNLSGPTNATIGDGQGEGTITNDDAAPTLAINSPSGSEAGGPLTFTITRTGATEVPITVNYATADGTAVSTAGGPGTPDFTATTGTASIAASLAATATTTFTVTLTNDAVYEASEQFTAALSGATGATIATATGTGTITNDDAAPSITVNDISVAENGAASFTVTLTGATALPIGVNFSTADGTALGGAAGPGTPDYTSTSGTLNFPASASGTQTLTVPVTLTNDATFEPTEQFVLNLSGATNGATIGDSQGVATITDDDPMPTLSIGDVTLAEGNSGTTAFTFTVTLGAASALPVTFDFATAAGTATAGTDYTTASGTGVTIAAGSTTQTVTVQVTGDTIFELDQTFFVNLSNVVGATVGDGQGLGTITNDDAAPTLTINSPSASEAGGPLTFVVTRTGATEVPVSVNYATADGTAVSTAGGPGTPDYTNTSGTASIAASLAATATTTFTVTLTNDAVYEGTEQFTATLSGATGATIATATGTGTITNDDAAPSIAINDVAVSESGAVSFTVTLTGATALPISVNFATADGTAVSTGSGAGVPDFTAASGTLNFPASASATQTLSVPVTIVNDSVNEANEVFVVNLTGATNGATISDLQGVATLVNDDGVPVLTIDDVTAAEGNAGTTAFTFTVSLSAASGQPVTVSFATADGTATGTDYTATSGSVTFAPGELTKTVTVLVTGETVFEVNQTFVVNLTSPTNATIGDGQGVGTITNDDAAPTLTINSPSGSEAGGPLTFVVTRTGATELPIGVSYATADGTAVSTAGGPGTPDYTAASGTVNFAPSLAATQTQTFTVSLTNDAVYEGTEQFTATLTGATGATIATATGTGTITNDDAAPSIAINDVSVSESGAVSFTVTLTGATALPIAVNFATADATAVSTAGGPGTPDFTAASGTLNFPASASGTQTLTVPVTLTNDTTNEPAEQFVVNLSGASNGATIGDSQGVATITDDDAVPSLTIDDVSLAEGNAGTTAFTFTVSLSAASAQTVTVNFATADGTATGTDYAAVSGMLTFAPGELTKTVTVLVTGDTIFEAAQTFVVNLTSPTNATIGDAQGVGTITNDDAAPTLTISDPSGSEAGGPLTFVVTRTGATELPIAVNFATADGTAVSTPSGPGTPDFTAASGTVNFAPSLAATQTQTFTVTPTNDAVYEGVEQFTATLSGATGASITDATGFGTITNDDAAPSIAINDVSVSESGTATFTVTLTGATALPIAVNFATGDATATATASATPGTPDYAAATGTVTFNPSASATQTQTIAVTLTNDTTNEAAEQFVVNLSGASNGATIGDSQGVATVTDDDPPPTVSVDDVTLAEGDAGTTAFTFTVSLSAPSAQQVSVNVATADNTALAGSDYAATGGTLIFTPGVTTQTFTVLVTGDTVFEPDQLFLVTLSGQTNAVLGDAVGRGTITNDDAAPTLTIDDVSVSEAAGTATFTVTRTGATEVALTVDYATADNTAVSTAGGPGTPDFTAATGTLSFTPSLAATQTQTLSVSITDDTVYEAIKQYFVNLSNPAGATVADGEGLGTITNDDAAPTISVGDITVSENGTATFTVTLTGATALPIGVDYATADGTAVSAGSATPGTPDYTATTGTLTFSPSASGTQTLTVTVPLTNDTTNEAAEQFVLNLSNSSNGSTISDAQAVGTITDDDPVPTVSVGDVTLAEGDAGTTAFTFTVTLSAASAQTVTVTFATADGTATGTDYTATSGTLTFAPGETTKTVTVLVTGDTVFETDEAFTLSVTGGTNVLPGAQLTGTGTITNDDAAPTLTIDDVSVSEAAGTATFTVTRTGATEVALTVDYATADATAVSTAGGPGTPDFTAATGTLTFAPSLAATQTQTISVSITDDNIYEAIKQYFVNLSNAAGATIADGTGLGTITNDDAAPTISVGDITVSENGTATFTVTLTGATALPIAVDYATADGTAVSAGSATPGTPDYAATTGTLTFSPSASGTQTLNVTVPLTNDTTNEAAEQFVLNLSNSSNGSTISDAQAVGTITDDDPVPTVSVGDVTLAEGDAGTTAFTFTVTLSAASAQAVTVTFATADGTATGTDYTAASGTLTFAPGETTKTVTVLVTGDTVFEPDQTFTVNLTGPANATVGDGQGVGTITNDDAAPTLSIADVTGAEGAGTLTFTVARTGATEVPISVTYATADGTATAGSDYTAAGGTLTFAPSLNATETQTFAVTVAGDTADELTETFTVTLSGATGATIVTGTSLGTITDDDLPVAAADTATTLEDAAVTAPTVLANDNFAPGSVVELVSTGTANGTLTLNPDGTFTYAPAADFNGTDTFQYRVRNTAGEVSAAATVTVTVTAVNDVPSFTKGPDQTVGRSPGAEAVPGWATAVSAGPADEAGQALTFTVTVTGTTGTLTFDAAPAVDASGALTFTPTATTFGTATVAVRLADSGGGTDTSATQTFTITVTKKSTADDTPVDQNDFARYVASAGPGGPGTVTEFTADGKVASASAPFGAGVGVRAVLADVTGDGTADLVAGTGPGVPGRLVVTDPATGKTILSDFPFGAGFTGGLFVAAGDVNADGRADIIVTPDASGGGRVVIYDGATGRVVASFLGIDDQKFRGGARVAVGDVNGDGVTDVIVSAGLTGGPRVAVFDGTSLGAGLTPKKLINDFFAFEESLRDGVYVAAGDLNGDGFADLVFGGGPGGGARVLARDGKSLFGPGATGQFVTLTNFFAGDSTLRDGVQLAVKQADGDGRADLVTAVMTPTGPDVRLYLGKDLGPNGGPFVTDLDPYPGLLTGIYVG